MAAPAGASREADLLRLRARKSAIDNLKSLEDLSVRRIHTGLDFYLSQEEPFEFLPPALLDAMSTYPPLAGQLQYPPLAQLVTTRTTRNIKLNFCPERDENVTWTMRDVQKTFQPISTKCAASLLGLELRLFQSALPAPSPEMLHELIVQLPRLRAFRFCGTAYSTRPAMRDQTLAVLGASCPDLRVVSIYVHPNLSPEAVIALCRARPQLEVLKVNLFYGVRAVDAVKDREMEATEKTIIALLPALRELTLRTNLGPYYFTPRRLLDFTYAHGNTARPHLRYLLYVGDEEPPVPEQSIAQVAQKFPGCEELNIVLSRITTLLHFTEFKQVKCLDIDGSEIREESVAMLARDLPRALVHWSSTLTSLGVASEEALKIKLDLSFLGHHCPRLETLTLAKVQFASTTRYPAGQFDFNHLKRLWIHGRSPVPTAVWRELLSGPQLKELFVGHMGVPSGVLSDLAAEARQHGLVFSALEKLIVSSTTGSLECWIDVLCVAPRLKMIDVNDDDVKNFVRENLLPLPQ